MFGSIVFVEGPTQDVRGMPQWHSDAHNQHINLAERLDHMTKLLPCLVPLIEACVHLEVFIVRIQQPLPLHHKLALLLQVVLQLLSFVTPDVYWIAALAAAELATVGRKCSASLHAWHLA